MSGAGSDAKLPAGSPDTVTAQAAEVSGELFVRPVVECGNCVYFRALDPAERPHGMEIDGDGNCFVEFPGSGTMQGTHPITQRPIVRFIAVRPIVKLGDVCRRWREREAFPGDAEIAQGEALEAMTDTLGEVVRYLREFVAAK